VRFWDSSAVVPLLVRQAASPTLTGWRAADAGMVLWTLTAVEAVSALERLGRERAAPTALVQAASVRTRERVDVSRVVVDLEAVQTLALRLLRLHPLRAFAALQLGAALHRAESRPHGRILHSLDGRLAEAARREGFDVPA
jgi:predicted nucleic acid-binding protein